MLFRSKKTSGSRTYPVGYGYDYAGRMQTMTNWSAYPNTGARVTTWTYNQYRGSLDSKTYDGNTAGPAYTYTAAGRLQTRHWARNITTTYNYDNAGGLATVAYDDGTTPGLSYAYDRRGRQATITQGTSAISVLAFNDANKLLSESYSGGTLSGLSVTNTFDQFLRRAALAVGNSSSPMLQHSFGYDTASRLATVTDNTGTTAYSATYTYLANSPLISQITFKQGTTTRMSTTKQYDFLNRLTSISSSSSISSSYAYNNANQRTRSTLADGSYWVYTYDALGQVVSGHKYWFDQTPVAGQQFDYAFDDIGNRTQTKAGGDENGANQGSANYSPNTINQYTSRDVPGAVDIMGISLAASTVTVNGQTAYRKGEYFRKQLSVNNGPAPVWESITVHASGQTDVTGHEFVPKTPEQFGYDNDGNLLSDGRWNYTWDAENRLVKLAARTSAGPQVSLQFEYDWKGRRIRKQVWNGPNWTGSITNDLKFVYDGWNLIAELDALNASTLLRSYVWGGDLSGTLQGAGGVGGLLFIGNHAAPIGYYSSAYDGNGNVMALISMADGTPAAQYEYGPFGEVTRATGPMAKVNPFRFSTKYQDDETDLLYYGYRYYKPSTGTWLSRDPLNAATDEEGRYELLEHYGFEQKLAWSIAEIPADLNDYLFVHNEPVKHFDMFGLDDMFGSLCSWASSGPGQFNPYTGPGWHHPPGTIGNSLTLRICCPKCNPYLTSYGITATPTSPANWPAWPWPISHPGRVFPGDWTTIPPINTSPGLPGLCYTITINVPTQTATFDRGSIGNVRVTGLCCALPGTQVRSDPRPPPPAPITPGPPPIPL